MDGRLARGEVVRHDSPRRMDVMYLTKFRQPSRTGTACDGVVAGGGGRGQPVISSVQHETQTIPIPPFVFCCGRGGRTGPFGIRQEQDSRWH